MTKTTGLLEVERLRGLRVGSLVQSKKYYGAKEPEGILVKISREKLGGQFKCWVNFEDEVDLIPFRVGELNYSGFLDFPSIEEYRLEVKPFINGVTEHKYVLDGSPNRNYAFCYYCGKTRVYEASKNNGLCTGPVKIGFR